MSGDIILPWLVSAGTLCGLGLFLFSWLRSSRCDPAISGLLTGLVLAQPAFWNFRISLGATLLSGAAGAVSFASLSFLKRQDVRRIALLGGSLAGAQLVNPLWGTVTTILVPFALRRRLDDGRTGGLTGLYVSILFIPVLTAVGVVALDQQFRAEVWGLAHLHSARAGTRALAASLLSAAPLATALALRPWGAPAAIVAAMGFALLTAGITLRALSIEFTSTSAALAVLSLALVAAPNQPLFGTRRAVLLLSSTLLASWIAVRLAGANV